MEVVGNDSASAYGLRPFDLRSFQFRKLEIKLKSDERERELSQASRGTEGIKLIFKLQNYKVIYGLNTKCRWRSAGMSEMQTTIRQ